MKILYPFPRDHEVQSYYFPLNLSLWASSSIFFCLENDYLHEYFNRNLIFIGLFVKEINSLVTR